MPCLSTIVLFQGAIRVGYVSRYDTTKNRMKERSHLKEVELQTFCSYSSRVYQRKVHDSQNVFANGPENHSTEPLSSASVVTCLNVLLPCLAHFEAGGPSKPAAVDTHLRPA